ncbi:MAG: sigma 54-interacting transcriptional regulator, partial [Clostridiales bacterium]|nr:sigma 54-interacting transcriptional regulator [Clostridiales bacterium]
MERNATPSGNRVHIGVFGLRNAGKSSVMNAITGQNASIVSEIKGATTDPVSKAMELLPAGPVVITDTPGLDDEGPLGEERMRRALRVLETGEFMKVGSSVTQKTDVRVVAATNRDMDKAIHEGRFREDLYYRLNTVEIFLPPLRGRREDIHLLFRK